jgi:uncharacterized RmlC-like cupin family protein
MQQVQVIHPDKFEVEISSGSMTRLAGVSKNLVGSEGIHLAVAVIPPGCRSEAHIHLNCESAIYIIKGHGIFLSGSKLDQQLLFGPGDCIYVPSGAPHQPINSDNMTQVEMIVARNAPTEIVEKYQP